MLLLCAFQFTGSFDSILRILFAPINRFCSFSSRIFQDCLGLDFAGSLLRQCLQNLLFLWRRTHDWAALVAHQCSPKATGARAWLPSQTSRLWTHCMSTSRRRMDYRTLDTLMAFQPRWRHHFTASILPLAQTAWFEIFAYQRASFSRCRQHPSSSSWRFFWRQGFHPESPHSRAWSD